VRQGGEHTLCGDNSWKADFPEFRQSVPKVTYRDKQICATGKITEYRNAPEIVATESRDIEMQK